jgi:hypothetical protein
LRIESNKGIYAKAPTITLDGDVNITGKSNMQGAVTMKSGLDMSNTDINNVANLRASNAILNALTLGGRTGTQSSPYNVWVANAAKASFADNAALLGGKAEGALSVAYAASAGMADGVAPAVYGKIDDMISESSEEGSLSGNGWTKLSNGLILQWGRTSIYSDTNHSVNNVSFPRSFTNACFTVVLAPYNPEEKGSADSFPQLISCTRSSFSFYFQNDSSGTAPLGVSYYAVGY